MLRVPAAQGRQTPAEVAPVEAEKVPAAQGAHKPAPACWENVPIGHCVALTEPKGQKVPGGAEQGEGLGEADGDIDGEQLGPSAHESVIALPMVLQPLPFGQQIEVPPHSHATALQPAMP